MKKLLFFWLTLIFIFSPFSQLKGFAYSYGDPGEEALAEAYKELVNYVNSDDWENVQLIYETYKKDFDLYFTKVQPDLERGIEEQDKELVLMSYEAALRLNIERRLHFAEDSFDDYGQAKLLLAKARGTFSVLESLAKEREGEETVASIYQAFDDALVALGNPGLFGIGSKENDPEGFKEKNEYIISELEEIFLLPSELDKDESHLTEDNLDLGFEMDEFGASSFWLWFTIGLLVLLILLIVVNKARNKK
ncbi:hypothetical protein [Halalkalibacter urbisdiaboli]|uniref:hypothetical protein n=1 Tax=Halalkalibacter urbisdiaboli TaxID=1960589 RepID=UPI000B43E8C9|nr:hypothetical protein [Halalkalibacter urbisdiaboli]